MNSVTAPSRARASPTNFVTSAVRSVKPAPDVCAVNSEDVTVVALTAEGVVRERDFGGVTTISPHVVPANAGTHTPRPLNFGRSELIPFANNQQRWLWVPAFAGTTRRESERSPQILPLTSLCTRFAMSIKRRHA